MDWIFYKPVTLIAILFLLLIGLIALIRISLFYHAERYKKQSHTGGRFANNLFPGRNKYSEVRVFSRYSTHLAIGFIFSLSFAAVLINWTSREVSMLQLTEKIPDIETPDIVVLQTPPPPPLPPAPPPKEQIVIETKADLDPVEFIDSEDDKVIEENLVEGADEDYRNEDIFRPPLPPIDTGSDSDPDEIILIPERMPRFPGCEDMGLTADELQMCSDRRLLEFVAKNIRFTSLARENRIEGVAVISFVVNRNGKIEDPKIVRDPGGGLGQQALRVVKMMNEMDESWIPGEQAGRKVNVRFNLPVRFVLE